MNREPILMATLVLIAFIIGGLYATYFYNLGKSIVPTTLPKTTTTTKITTTTTTSLLKENLEIVYAYADYNKTIPGWTVHILVKNAGNKVATIDKVFINAKPFKQLSLEIKPEEQVEIKLYLTEKQYSSAQMICIEIHTLSGRQYPTTITLP